MDIRQAARISLIVGILLISFSVFYYFVIFLPEKERVKRELDSEIKTTETEAQARREEIYSDCHLQAEKHAAQTLKDKSRLPGGYIYKEAADKDLFLEDDYKSAYERCLRANGMEVKP